MGSTAFCLPAVHHVLQLANPEGLPWLCSNEAQRDFFARYGEAGVDVARVSAWLTSKVTADADAVRTWLAERGWPEVAVPVPADGLAVASVFDLLVEWSRPGLRKSIRVPVKGKKRAESSVHATYDGVEMRGSEAVQGYRIAGHAKPLFDLATRYGGWKVSLVEVPSISPLDLPAVAADLLAMKRTPLSLSTLRFPAVEMRAAVDVSWLRGLCGGDLYRIADATKKVSLRVDERGAHARSVAGVGRLVVGRGLDPYEITTPFLVIFWREGLRAPAFVALSDTDSWLPR